MSTSARLSGVSSDISQDSIHQGSIYGWHEDVEVLEHYRSGGLHPVHLDETYHNGRYRIVHKLGHGSFSTVWLAWDTQRSKFAALKFLRADMSATSTESTFLARLAFGQAGHPGRDHVQSLIDVFFFTGPNGRHQTIVTEVAGLSVAGANGESPREKMLPPHMARAMAAQFLQALSYVHSCGLVHGDLHSNNILLKHSPAATLSMQELYKIVGEPQRLPVDRNDGEPTGPEAPQYCVPPVLAAVRAEEVIRARRDERTERAVSAEDLVSTGEVASARGTASAEEVASAEDMVTAGDITSTEGVASAEDIANIEDVITTTEQEVSVDKATSAEETAPSEDGGSAKKVTRVKTVTHTNVTRADIVIADFGEAFLCESGSRTDVTVGTPALWRPPEAMMKEALGQGADIWSAACTVYEILGPKPLFFVFLPYETCVMAEIVCTMGRLPEKWWNSWEARQDCFLDDGSLNPDIKMMFKPHRRSLAQRLTALPRHEEDTKQGFSTHELAALEELLGAMLAYEPSKRITAAEALESKWMTQYGLPAIEQLRTHRGQSGLF